MTATKQQGRDGTGHGFPLSRFLPSVAAVGEGGPAPRSLTAKEEKCPK
jgi:hypothetical protein